MILALMGIARLYPWVLDEAGAGRLTLSLGLVILAGYLLGEIGADFKLPRITGYLLAGMLLGPHLSGLLSKEFLGNIALIDQIALALIALSAGGELYVSSLKARWKGIAVITLFQAVLVLLGGAAAFYWISGSLPFLSAADTTGRLAAALVFGVIAIAQSPATTIAVITESRASGPFTETVLGITVIKDVLVIVLFTLLVPLVKMMELSQEGMDFGIVWNLGGEIVLSAAAGVAAGWGISFYLKHIRKDPVLFILAFCFLVSEGSKTFHLDTLIVCIMAGAWVANTSERGETMIKMIEQSSLIVYVVFFTITGALLDLNALYACFGVALFLTLARMGAMYAATTPAAWISGERHASIHTLWMAFLAQAGVSLGLVTILAREGISWGRELQTIVVAVIAMNQIAGPILLKYALKKTGETLDAKRTAQAAE